MNFIEYIESQGYKPMRYTLEGREWKYIESKNNSFSTMVSGGLNIRYIKEGYKDIIYGLHEFGKPPTLINPRPINLCYKEGDSISDDTMNRVLQKYTGEEIFNDLMI